MNEDKKINSSKRDVHLNYRISLLEKRISRLEAILKETDRTHLYDQPTGEFERMLRG